MADSSVYRRRLLAALGTVGFGAVAGCSSTDSTGEATERATTAEGATEATTPESTAETGTETETADELTGPDEFVGVDGTSFTLGDGTFYASGAELPPQYAYGLTHPNREQIRPIIFDALENVGATVARTHAYDYAPVELGTPFPGEDNEEFFELMDRAIVEAKRRDIRLSVIIVNAAPHYHLDPEEHFGMHVPAFVHHVDSAGEIDDFYTNDECIELYKEWVTELLTRENHVTGVEYRNDPTIMMWELGNEVEWTEPWTRDSQTIRPWIEEVAPHVQDVMDGDQLVTTGEAGWPDDRNDFRDDHAPDGIDVCSAHWWVGPAHYDLPDDEADALFERLVETAHGTLEKPLWIGEYNLGFPERGSPGKIDEEFLERRNERLREWHNWMDEADVAGAILHNLGSKEIHEEIFEHDHHNDFTTVYGDADEGTITELRRYAERTREKSTASAVPELPPRD